MIGDMGLDGKWAEQLAQLLTLVGNQEPTNEDRFGDRQIGSNRGSIEWSRVDFDLDPLTESQMLIAWTNYYEKWLIRATNEPLISTKDPTFLL